MISALLGSWEFHFFFLVFLQKRFPVRLVEVNSKTLLVIYIKKTQDLCDLTEREFFFFFLVFLSRIKIRSSLMDAVFFFWGVIN